MQNVVEYQSHVAAGPDRVCGGVAVLVRAGHYRELHSHVHRYWVASALRCTTTGETWVVCAVYVPPATSRYYDGDEAGMGGYLDAMLEDVRAL